jgi:hypothetical protein
MPRSSIQIPLNSIIKYWDVRFSEFETSTAPIISQISVCGFEWHTSFRLKFDFSLPLNLGAQTTGIRSQGGPYGSDRFYRFRFRPEISLAKSDGREIRLETKTVIASNSHRNRPSHKGKYRDEGSSDLKIKAKKASTDSRLTVGKSSFHGADPFIGNSFVDSTRTRRIYRYQTIAVPNLLPYCVLHIIWACVLISIAACRFGFCVVSSWNFTSND